MEPTTLYYYFSTISQVLAAISALLAVFTHFKINETKEFLVGDGNALFEKMKLKDPGYDIGATHKKYFDRLRDSIGRKNILGILDVVKVLAQNEKKEGKTLITNPRGFQFLESRFILRINQIKMLKKLTKKSIICAFIAIFISIVSLLFVEQLVHNWVINYSIIFILLISTLLSMIFTLQGVFHGLMEQEDI